MAAPGAGGPEQRAWPPGRRPEAGRKRRQVRPPSRPTGDAWSARGAPQLSRRAPEGRTPKPPACGDPGRPPRSPRPSPWETHRGVEQPRCPRSRPSPWGSPSPGARVPRGRLSAQGPGRAARALRCSSPPAGVRAHGHLHVAAGALGGFRSDPGQCRKGPQGHRVAERQLCPGKEPSRARLPMEQASLRRPRGGRPSRAPSSRRGVIAPCGRSRCVCLHARIGLMCTVVHI